MRPALKAWCWAVLHAAAWVVGSAAFVTAVAPGRGDVAAAFVIWVAVIMFVDSRVGT
jgi:hypothetical protein